MAPATCCKSISGRSLDWISRSLDWHPETGASLEPELWLCWLICFWQLWDCETEWRFLWLWILSQLNMDNLCHPNHCTRKYLHQWFSTTESNRNPSTHCILLWTKTKCVCICVHTPENWKWLCLRKRGNLCKHDSLDFFDLCFLGGSDGKESACQCRRLEFYPWVKKIPWRREWQPTPVLLPGESHGQRSLPGYSPLGRKESDMAEQLSQNLMRFF